MNKATLTLAGFGLALSGTSMPHAAELATILLPQEQEIQMALEAGPEHVRDTATVYVFGAEGYRRVRNGTNGFTCMVNRDGNQKGDNDLKPTCWDAEGGRTIVPVMLRVGELIARSASAQDIQRDIEAGLVAIAEIFGRGTAERVQLQVEYAPAPPFEGGRPENARAEVTAQVCSGLSSLLAADKAAVEAAVRRLQAQ